MLGIRLQRYHKCIQMTALQMQQHQPELKAAESSREVTLLVLQLECRNSGLCRIKVCVCV